MPRLFCLRVALFGLLLPLNIPYNNLQLAPAGLSRYTHLYGMLSSESATEDCCERREFGFGLDVLGETVVLAGGGLVVIETVLAAAG